jgi:undecaprenyl-phosphate 4-deoxy-4-formamido-L-arabinose transferase
MLNQDCLISLVIPVFNEEANLHQLIERCLSVCRGLENPFEIILVDDGSQDQSAKLIEYAALANPELKGVFLNRNYGQHAAVTAGFETSKGEIIITLDADLQNPPEEIPRLIQAIHQGYDVVGSVRQNRKDSFFRKFSSALVNWFVQKTTGVMMHDYGCMLRAYRRNIVDAVLSCPERSTFIPILANNFARNVTEIPVSHNERKNGHTKYSLYKLISLQFDLLTCMTTFPLRLLSILGALAFLAGTGFGVFLIVMRLIFGASWAAEGVFTLFAVMFTFTGAQFLVFGLLGEYIGRIYYEVQARPKYYIQKIVGPTD